MRLAQQLFIELDITGEISGVRMGVASFCARQYQYVGQKRGVWLE